MEFNDSVLTKLLDQDYRLISKNIESFISRIIMQSQTAGIVLGLSGGLDSSVVVKCSVNALGSGKILGLILPTRVTPNEDVDHAIALAKELRIEFKVVDIDPLVESYLHMLSGASSQKNKGNLMARIRMNILYYYAGLNNCLVAGTSDKSELYIGFYTKYGDGGSDLMPIANLYKTQVRSFARFLNIPNEVIEKKSSPRLWANHLAEDEIGMTYELIDSILYLLIDVRMIERDVATKLNVPLDTVLKVKGMIDNSAHKRKMPEIAEVKPR